MTSVVVCGCAGVLPLAGVGLHYLQYCLGLNALGCEVSYLEETALWAYNPAEDRPDDEGSYTVPWLGEMFGAFGIDWAFRDARGRYHNATAEEVRDRCARADLLLNVSGAHEPIEHHREAKVLAYIDTDPGFIQVRATSDTGIREWLGRHDLLFTFAEAMGSPPCRIPDAGFQWKTTRQPVWLPFWADVDAAPGQVYTTVMNWRAYDPVECQGEQWGQKDAEFPMVRDLPARTSLPLELALGGAPAPRADLQAAGWRLADPLEATRTIWTFRDYIAASRGELSVAKQCYVRSGSGWFSERSANYLAAGRPVIAQDTGWSVHVPTEDGGAHAFRTTEEAEAALAVVEADPAGEGKKARAVAERYFDARAVMERLLSDAGVD